ncbi:MAG: NAD-binding protein [Owenweeksia sp.]|nr:NAD-binding protein [Owenweeksia sp.]
MDIIIAGAGAVGMHLAKWLSSESHDITLIDSDHERLANIDKSIDAITIPGQVTDFKVLERAKVSHGRPLLFLLPPVKKPTFAVLFMPSGWVPGSALRASARCNTSRILKPLI